METSSSDTAIIADFAALLVARTVDLLGPKAVSEVVGTKSNRGLFGLGKDKAALALAGDDALEQKKKTESLISLLSNAFGVSFADQHLEDIYTKLEKKHSPALANSIILPLIPPAFLEKYRLHFLSKEELEVRVLEKTKEVQKLGELDKRRSEFLSVVAHQLRTPLTGIKWALHILRESKSEPLTEAQRGLITSCQEGNERMMTIVNKMLRADQISAETFELHPVATDLIELAGSVIEDLRLASEARNVTVTYVHDAIPPLMIDPEMMRFAFQNLIDNAIKYSPTNGAVEVRIGVQGDLVNCTVTDHGIGIPVEEQAYIFSRFFRAKNAVSAEPNGSGLGLFIVKSILEKHGGSVRFTSEENKGTTFYCVLPYNLAH